MDAHSYVKVDNGFVAMSKENPSLSLLFPYPRLDRRRLHQSSRWLSHPLDKTPWDLYSAHPRKRTERKKNTTHPINGAPKLNQDSPQNDFFFFFPVGGESVLRVSYALSHSTTLPSGNAIPSVSEEWWVWKVKTRIEVRSNKPERPRSQRRRW